MATLHEVAAHLGVTIKYVQDLIANGTLEKKGRGEYDLDACREAYITRLREAAAGRANSGDLNLTDERARLAKEQADAKEMENMVERGELLYIEDVVSDFEEQLMNCKTKLLAAPTKVAAEAFAAKDVQEVQTIFELAVKDALSELVGYRQKEAA